MSNYGIVEYFGSNESSYPCGYCKGFKDQNTDYGKSRFGLWAHSLSPINYQNLIDRNWRRSGKYCYKPVLQKTCCPLYTIRCDALNFKLRKSHKKVLKKFNKFLLTGEKPSKRRETELRNDFGTDMSEEQKTAKPLMDEMNINRECTQDINPINEFDVIPDNTLNVKSNERKTVSDTSVHKKTKAKTLRIERKLKKIMEREKCDEIKAKDIMSIEFLNRTKNRIKIKTLGEYLTENENHSDRAHKLEIKFVSTTTDEYKETFESSHEVYKKYQMAIHGDTDDKCTAKQYKRFLIDSPLDNEDCQTREGLPNSFESYHQQYWLDNKLIAVGVLDILPNCVSSVYLYYDPEYDFLSLGTYSALREIYLVQQLHQFIPNLKYYYMGFYVHSCPKMKYKGKFLPSELLCGETFSWHPINKCTPKLDAMKYSRFEDNPNVIDSAANDIKDSEILILYERQVIPYQQYKKNKRISTKEDQQIKEYAKLIGRKCSHQILLYRS